MTPTKAFIFKGVPAPFHHGALAVCRTLGRMGVDVAANDEGPRVPAGFSRYRAERLVWDPWPTDVASIVERLLEWGRRQDERPLLITVDDAAMMIVDDHGSDLEAAFRFPVQPPGLALQLSNKWEMAELAEAHGVATARVTRVESQDHLDEVLPLFGLPVVVKRIAGWSPGARGMPSVTLARTRDEAAAVGSTGWDNLLLQEFIPGTSASSWMFNGYFDSQSQCLFGLTGYKIRQFPVNGGFTTLGRLEQNDDLLRTAVDFFSGIDYVGIVDVGFRFDARDSKYKLLDVNPRVGSTFRLFVDAEGHDVVRTCYEDLAGGTGGARTLSAPPRTWEVEPHDLRVGRQLIRAGRTSMLRFLSSAATVDERAWWAADDPKPSIAAALYGAVLKGRRSAAKSEGSASEAADSAARPDDPVRAYFEKDADYWGDIYEASHDVAGGVYRERLGRALAYVDALGLPVGARIVDVGTGAGVAAIALALRGFDVVAVDVATRMLELTRERATEAGVEIEVVEGDARHLPLPDDSCDLVLALGLLPWVEDTSAVLAEFKRVLRPGGAVVVSADNRWRLAEMVDPALSAIVAPLRRRVAPAVRTVRRRAEPAIELQRQTITELRRLLEQNGFDVVSASTVGYGPVTFMRKAVLNGFVGTTLARTLSRHGGSILLRQLGVHVVACATSPPCPAGGDPTAAV